MSTEHSHSIPSTQNERALWFALVLTSTFMTIEFGAGLLMNSLALLSDASHMLTDASALAIALAAMKTARRPVDFKRTYGYHRFEILAAAFNALLLFGVAIYILYEAYERFRSPVEIHSTGMMIVAGFGLAINLISIRLLSSGKDISLNLKGAYLEVWSDMLGSIGVLIGGIVIRYTGWGWVDTVVAIGIGFWVLPRTWILLKESLNILLEGAPKGIDADEIRKAIAALSGVVDVHDLHVWVLTSSKNSLTVHVVQNGQIQSDVLISKIREILAARFQVFHSTIQIELTPCEHSADGCNFIDHRKKYPGSTDVP
ncbi:MAG: cation transporter [Gammaproteobacteria bacterium]|jgi:cobalt-zinc-cadmium efflux system protein|nr:cation transporter [Gammaproteobacteria bacterium]